MAVPPPGDSEAAAGREPAYDLAAGPVAAARTPLAPATSSVRSPVVRRLIAEHQLDPANIAATGNGGRITRGDVASYLAGRDVPAPAGDRVPVPSHQAASHQAAARPAAARPAASPERGPGWTKFNTIQRRTGERLAYAHATIPQVTTATVVDFERVQRLRIAAGDAFRAQYGVGLTFLPIVARAVLSALAGFPRLNARVDGDGITVHPKVHLGIAVDLNHEGLVVPVVRDAAAYRLPALAQRISELSRDARSKRLTVDDLTGSTLTITSPGSYGTLVSTPIINPPEVAIVSVEGISKQVVVVPDPHGGDGIAIHHVGVVAISYDHRAVDGAYAAAFLARAREIIEATDWQAEL
jgi:2-oxoglutarate dehydrogenase E2 component (dihydrolipoamide succinyltransferase)